MRINFRRFFNDIVFLLVPQECRNFKIFKPFSSYVQLSDGLLTIQIKSLARRDEEIKAIGPERETKKQKERK